MRVDSRRSSGIGNGVGKVRSSKKEDGASVGRNNSESIRDDITIESANPIYEAITNNCEYYSWN